jgi:2-dehydropantoate 2-reductase
MSNYHVSVIGGGSVGLCLAVHFAKSGARVSLLVRKAAMQTLDGAPIEVTGALGSHVARAGAIAMVDAANPDDDVLRSDMLVFTTKAYDVEAALRPFAGQITKSSVLLMQNGIGSAEIARKTLGPDVPIFSTSIMIGMVRHAPNKAEVSGYAGPIRCGTLHGDDIGPLEDLLNVAQQGFVPMVYDPAIRETMSSKLLLNSCLNPTGALTGQTYGELLENPVSRQLIVDLADETLAVFARAFDYRPAQSGQHYVDETLGPMVRKAGGKHQSSMLQDLRAGRKTEIEFLNGAIINMAKDYGVMTPRHDVVRQLIKARESP